MPKALQHEFPRWEGDDRDPTQDVYAWPGAPRFVSAKRARKLRKRGVPLMPCHRVHDPSGEHRPGQFYPTHGDKARYCWFERTDDAEARRWRRAANCYETWREAEQGLRGRKHELQERLESQRADHAARAYFRQGGKLAATTYYQTFERHGLYAGVIHENVLNPQLDLYAEVARQIGLATPEQLDAAASVDMSDYYAALENPLQRATRETMLQAERDGLVQRVVSFARADGGVDEVDPFGRVTQVGTLRSADEYAGSADAWPRHNTVTVFVPVPSDPNCQAALGLRRYAKFDE